MQCPSERCPEFSTRIKGSLIFVLPAKNKAPVVYHYQDLGEILHAQMFACMDKKIYIYPCILGICTLTSWDQV